MLSPLAHFSVPSLPWLANLKRFTGWRKTEQLNLMGKI